MSSEMTFKVILVVGNTHTKRRDSQDEVTGKLYDSGVYVSWHLSLRLYRKACIQKISNRAEPTHYKYDY